MTCKTRKNTTIVIMAITSVLLVPTTIVVVTAYTEQRQQQQKNEDRQLQETHTNNNNDDNTNTVGSVGNTSTDDSNPEYNATKAAENPALTQEEIDMRVNDLLVEIDGLYFENHGLYETVSDESMLDEHTLDRIAQNNQTVQTLWQELDMLYPILPEISIPEEDMKRLEAAKTTLRESDLPWFVMGINRATATLDITVDIDLVKPDTEEKIRKLTKDVPVIITYSKNEIQRHAEICDGSTKYCDPLVSGAEAEDEKLGSHCTILLAVRHYTWWGLGETESGVLIPKHCDPSNTTYYQPNNDNATHKIGKATTTGGESCNCKFT